MLPGETEEQRGKILFMSLSGWLDGNRDEIEKELRGVPFCLQIALP